MHLALPFRELSPNHTPQSLLSLYSPPQPKHFLKLTFRKSGISYFSQWELNAAGIDRLTFNLKRKLFDLIKNISGIDGQTIMELIIVAEGGVGSKF